MAHVPLNVTIYVRKWKRHPAQVRGLAYKMTAAPADSRYIGIWRPEDNG
jgi:hypothetical protein